MSTGMTRFALLLSITAASVLAQEKPVDMQQRTKELQDLKWGMFICWSFSTFSGKEWTPGITDLSLFRAKSVDTDQWARTAKEAGMGYILFLTKHHDGFCLWDTKTTDRKVTNAPLGRDVLAELKKSCDTHGIKLALYFSEGEWRHSGGVDDPATPGPKGQHQGGRNPEMKKAQLKELLTQYGPIEYIWFDHAIGDGGLNHQDTVAFCKELQPGCFVGFNHGPAAGDIRLGEMGHPAPLDNVAGAGFNSGHMKGYTGYRLAEFTYPILPGHDGGASWFYSLPKHDRLCKPAEALYRDYLGAVKYGNVFALDVGPDYEGKLRDIDVATLRQIGTWIRDPSQAPQPPPPALSDNKPATASTTWGASYEADKACDSDMNTRWGAAPGTKSGWLEVDLGKDEEVGRVEIIEESCPRTEAFTIEYRVNDSWKELVRGTTIGKKKVLDFTPVAVRRIRLNILKANEVPTIDEFRVLPPVNVNK